MKDVQMYLKGDRVMIEMEVFTSKAPNGDPEYELKDPYTGEFLDHKYKNDRLFPIADTIGDPESEAI